MIGAILVAVGAIAGGVYLVTKPGGEHNKNLAPVLGQPVEGPQVVALVAMTEHDTPDGAADSLTLFAVDRTGRNPVTVFVPTGTLVQIPAFTYGPVGDALTRSDYTLKLAAENLIGVGVDRTFVFDDVAMGEILDALGGVDVNVTEEIYVTNDEGGKELEFQKGSQHMDAAAAVTYMTDRGGQTEVQRFARQQKVWESIFDMGSSRVADAIRQVSKDSLEPEEASSLAEVLGAMAARPAADRLFEPLPAQTVLSGGGDETYNATDVELDALVKRDFPSSMLGGIPSARPRVEVRNADGAPGGGEKAAALLIEGGMRVVLGQNAGQFGLKKTKILIYTKEQASLDLGEKIKALLGRGSVEVSEAGQTVVQATVVVGHDFVKG